MRCPAVFALVPVGIIFFLSGLFVNVLQAVVYILIRPFSKNLYRRANKVVVELLWLELVWLVDWWSNLKIEVFADDETLKSMGREHALLVCNHRSDIDWLVGWVLAQRSGCLGTTLALMKREAKMLPIIGWSMWFSDYVFLERNWAKDKATLKTGLKWLEDFPIPFWLAIFVEGTRFTQEKLEVAQQFAAFKGLPIPQNVLLPRTKGFVAAVSNMRAFVPAIYDCTVAVPRNQPAPTMLRLFRRQPTVVNIQIARHSMQELPESEDGIAQWVKDDFMTKDAFLQRFFSTDAFGSRKHQDIGRPMKSLLVMVFWFVLFGFGMCFAIQRLIFLGCWGVMAFCVTFIVLVMIIMQTLIHSSESEHSTPPNPVLPYQLEENLIERERFV